jgi:hypothetical protein
MSYFEFSNKINKNTINVILELGSRDIIYIKKLYLSI